MAFRGVTPPPDPEPGTYARLRKELAVAEAAVVKILEAAPKATTKYPDAARAGRAVLDALSRALRDHADAENKWLRWKREHTPGGR
jgi:hypothetical protein